VRAPSPPAYVGNFVGSLVELARISDRVSDKEHQLLCGRDADRRSAIQQTGSLRYFRRLFCLSCPTKKTNCSAGATQTGGLRYSRLEVCVTFSIGQALFRPLEFVAVLALDAVTSGEIAFVFVVLPNLMVAGLPGLAAQRALFEDIARGIAVQLQKPGFLVAVPTVGQDDQYFSLHELSDTHRIRDSCNGSQFFRSRQAGQKYRRPS
jgi:hypothetical protein